MSTARTTRLSRCRRTSVRLLSASGAASVVLASFLLGALDFALVKATTTPRRVEPFGLLELVEAVDRLGRFDWRISFAGAFIGLLLSAVFPPESVREVLMMLAQSFRLIPVSYTHLTLPTNR